MSPPRFYVPQLTRPSMAGPSHCQVIGPEAKHATQVLRLREGSEIELFNGLGDAVRARILAGRKDCLECECLAWNDYHNQLSVDVTLLIALPKGDRQRVLVDATTELGVSRLVPLITQRGVAQPTDSALERLQRTVIEACKQSGRNRLMEIAPPVTLNDLCQPNANSVSALRFVAHPYTGPYELKPLMQVLPTSFAAAKLVIGPEGGLTEAEANNLASSGWQMVELGSTILRIEVAAISAISQIIGWCHAHRDATAPAT